MNTTTEAVRTLKNTQHIQLRYRYFIVKYIGATNFKPSRIKIQDVRRCNAVTMSYDSIWNSPLDQAANHLESIGIGIDALAMGNKDGETLILTKNFETELR